MLKELWLLFITFARIGGLTFGGGYAMLPILQREVVNKYHWTTEEELMDYYAIGQCTPGIIAINTATFIGFQKHGIIGGIVATLGSVFPSLVIISTLTMFLEHFAEYPVAVSALNGIQVCVCVLVLTAVLKLSEKSLKNKFSYVLFFIIVILSICTNISAAILILAVSIIGAIHALYLSKKSGGSAS
ncbi:MAG: chromate transporter [Lachnospiraceae bacterium]